MKRFAVLCAVTFLSSQQASAGLKSFFDRTHREAKEISKATITGQFVRKLVDQSIALFKTTPEAQQASSWEIDYATSMVYGMAEKKLPGIQKRYLKDIKQKLSSKEVDAVHKNFQNATFVKYRKAGMLAITGHTKEYLMITVNKAVPETTITLSPAEMKMADYWMEHDTRFASLTVWEATAKKMDDSVDVKKLRKYMVYNLVSEMKQVMTDEEMQQCMEIENQEVMQKFDQIEKIKSNDLNFKIG